MEEDLNSILHKQQLFCSSLTSYFFRKITKYQNILLKNGVQLSDQNCDDNFDSLSRNQSFEDHIELVIGQKSASPNVYKKFLKIGNRLSTLKLFRWIYLIVQRTKAARVLHHLDGIADDEIKDVINSVGQEISIAFEYQLYVLDGESEVVKLAQHAGACMITYLNSKEAEFTPESLHQAVLEVKPQCSNNKEILKTRTICFNNDPVCLRWRLSQVFKQPGLRINLDEPNKSCKEKSSSGAQTDISAEKQATGNADCNFGDDLDIHQSAEADQSTDSKDKLDTREEDDESANESNNAQAQAICTSIKTTQKRTKMRRLVNEVDMDFENNEMTITERSVEASEFSSVGNKTFDAEDGDSTSIEEDLNSETYSVDDCNKNITRISAICSDSTPQGNTKVITEEHPKNIHDLNNVLTTHEIQINGEVNDIGFNDYNETVAIETLYNENIENKDDLDIEKAAETQRPQCNTFVTSVNLVDVQNVHVENDINDRQANSEGNMRVNDASNTHPDDNGIHINSSDNIKADTYQVDTNGVCIVNVESLPKITDFDRSYIFYGCFTPYGSKCRPKIYGYRGPLHIWNEYQRKYSLIYNDIVTLARKQPHDSLKPQLIFHQRYIPKTVCKH